MMYSNFQLIGSDTQFTSTPTLPRYIVTDTRKHYFISDGHLAYYEAVADWMEDTLVIIINCRFFGSYQRDTFAITL